MGSLAENIDKFATSRAMVMKRLSDLTESDTNELAGLISGFGNFVIKEFKADAAEMAKKPEIFDSMEWIRHVPTLKDAAENLDSITKIKKETIERSKPCPKCGWNKFTMEWVQLRGLDEGRQQIYKCSNPACEWTVIVS